MTLSIKIDVVLHDLVASYDLWHQEMITCFGKKKNRRVWLNEENTKRSIWYSLSSQKGKSCRNWRVNSRLASLVCERDCWVFLLSSTRVSTHRSSLPSGKRHWLYQSSRKVTNAAPGTTDLFPAISKVFERVVHKWRVSYGLGWPANAMYFYNRIRERTIFSLKVNDNEIVQNTSDGLEGKSGLMFGALYLKLLVPTCLAISRYPWHWEETKWLWLATQDHAKLVYKLSDFLRSWLTSNQSGSRSQMVQFIKSYGWLKNGQMLWRRIWTLQLYFSTWRRRLIGSGIKVYSLNSELLE